MLNVSHHLPNNDDLWSQLFVDGEDVNETDGEDHVIHAKDIPAKVIRPVEHPERINDINYGNSTTKWSTLRITAICQPLPQKTSSSIELRMFTL